MRVGTLYPPAAGVTVSAPWLGEPKVLSRVGTGRSAQILRITELLDGRFALCGWESIVSIVDAGSDTLDAILVGHGDYVYAVCALRAHGGRWLLSGGNGDHIIRGHDLTRAHSGGVVLPKRNFIGHLDAVCDIVELTEGRFVSASQDHTLRIWHFATETLVATLSGHRSYVTAVVFVEAENKLVSAGQDCTLRMWDARTYNPISTTTTPRDIHSLLRLTDGSFVTGHDDSRLRFWDRDCRHLLATAEPTMMSYHIRSLSQTATGFVAAGDGYNNVCLYDPSTAACIGHVNTPEQVCGVHVSASGRMVMGGRRDCLLVVLDPGWARRAAAVAAWEEEDNGGEA